MNINLFKPFLPSQPSAAAGQPKFGYGDDDVIRTTKRYEGDTGDTDYTYGGKTYRETTSYVGPGKLTQTVELDDDGYPVDSFGHAVELVNGTYKRIDMTQ